MYLVVSKGGQYTKHIYIGSQRIVSKLGDLDSYGQDPRRLEYAGSEVDGAKVDYKAKYKQSQQTIKDRYAYFEVPYYGKDNDDYVNGGGFCCNDAPTTRSFDPSKNDNPELYQFYYHSDHLGSSSLITNLDGEIVQHIEYVPFGEVFIEERNNKWNTPFLFNAKELDEETGLYYYGARYYDPRTSLWISTDPLQEKYPNISSYAYCVQNPVKYVDPNGMDWYQHSESGATFWEEGNAKSVDRDGQSYSNIGAAYIQVDGDKSISFMQDQILSVSYLDERSVGGDRFNSQLGQGTMSSMEQWSNSNNFFASLSYNILNDAYVTLQPLTFELFTGGGRTNEFTGGHALVNLDGSTNYKGIESVANTAALFMGAAEGASALKAATGGSKQWLRVGSSYSHYLGNATELSIRWGASPRYANKIGNSTLRRINQSIRGMKLPGNNWRVNDSGHFHLKK